MRQSCIAFAAVQALLASSVALAQSVPAVSAPDSISNAAFAVSDSTLQRLDVPELSGEVFAASVLIDDQPRTLYLTPHSMRSADFEVLVHTAAGFEPVDVTEPATYRGYILGISESRVAASLSPEGLHAMVDARDGGLWVIQPALGVLDGVDRFDHVVYRAEDALPSDGVCGVVDAPDMPLDPEDGVALGTGLRIVEIGVDADSQFLAANGNSVTNTVNDIENVMNSTEFVYERDVDVTFEITTIVIRTSGADPYTGTNSSNLLGQFQTQWTSNSLVSGIRRDVGHYFTGRNLSGSVIGVAYLGTVCSTTSGYSLVESKFSNNLSARVALSAHELGHTFGAGHCDAQGSACKIMCSGLGGCGGIGLPNFGVNESNVIAGNAAGLSCLTPLADPVPLPFSDSFAGSLNSAPLASLWAYNDGGLVTNLAANEPSSPHSLQLASTGADTYGDDDEVRTNFIQLAGQSNVRLRYYTQHSGVEAGEKLFVEYWASNNRWVLLNEIVSNGVNQTTFTFHEHLLPGGTQSAYHNEFRVRFRVDGNESNDIWCIDDVSVAVGAPPPPNIAHQLVEVPITPAAVADNPALAGKKCYDLRVTMSNGDDWTATEAVATVSGSFYQDSSGADVPLPALWASNASLQFDSFWSAPNFAIPSFAVPPSVGPGALSATWFDTTDSPTGTYTLARYTVLSGQTLTVTGSSTTQQGFSTLFPFSLVASPNLDPGCVGDLNGDGQRDLADLGALLTAYGVNAGGDLDGDGDTDLSDLGGLLSVYGVPCP